MGCSKIKIKNITHNTISFVDHTTNVIGFKDHNLIKTYLENYFQFLIKYYNINKLKLNNDKTKLLIVKKSKHESLFKNFKFQAGDDMIEPKKCIKILGFMLQDDLKIDREINKISSQLHNRINNIRSLTKYTTFSTCLKFLNAYVIGKLNYMVPMYSIADLVNLNKLHKIITTAGRAAIGSYCHKKA